MRTGKLLAKLLALWALCLCGNPAFAQFTLVSGTITDPSGIPWACGTISATLINGSGVSPTLNGVGFSGFTAPVKLGCPTDPTTSRTAGFFQMQLADNTQIKCGISACGTQTTWQFTVNTTGIAPPQGTGPQSFSQTFTISGSTQTLTFSGVPALSLASSGSGAGQFTASAFGAVYDDSTDNCTAFQNLTAAAAAYAGPGIPSISFAPPSGNSGKAYKISCNIVFTVPADIEGYGAVLDCQQNNTFANCVQFGPSNLVNFTNAQTPPYRFQDFTFASGSCVNVTVACIEAELWVSNPQILRIHAANVGAGNASPPACTNWFISFDGHNNAPQIIDNEYWNTDSTTGRCWSTNNRTGASGGTNSALIEHNTVIGAGATPGFTGPCGSVGHTELGSATIIKGNQFFGFGQPVVMINPQQNTMLQSNQFDQDGCTTNVANADIHFGNGSNGAVGGVQIIGNYFANHANEAAMSISQGSTSAVTSVVFSGNSSSSSSSAKSFFPSNTPFTCTGNCFIANNTNFFPHNSNGSWYDAGSVLAIAGQVAQSADVTAQNLIASVPNAAVYRVSCELKITQAATISSTLPACFIGYTDADTSTVTTKMITPNWAATTPSCSGSTTNTVGNSCGGSAIITAKAGTAISYSTSGYASSGATPMQFTIRGRAELLN